MTSNICRLYPEILSHIFENARNMTEELFIAYSAGFGENPDNAMAFEDSVTGVCSYFRSVALTTPRLWTSIHIHEASAPGKILKMLARSGDCSLDIRIGILLQLHEIDTAWLDSIINAILAHSLRWRTLHITYSCETRDYPVVMRLCSAPAPSLRQLSISVHDVDAADGSSVNRSVDLPHIFADGTPNLSFIRLRGFAVQLFRPPLNAVVTLHLDQVNAVPILYSTLSGILTQSPRLAHLSMYGDILSPGGWENQRNKIYLPTMSSLRVCSISGETFSGIMINIDAPNLQFITMQNLHENDLDPLWALNNSARFDTVKSVNFMEFGLSVKACQRVFENFREITNFSELCSFSASGRQSTILQSLADAAIAGPDEPQCVPWPNLKTLCLVSDVYSDNEDVINMLIEGRKGQGRPITTLKFKINEEDEVDMLSLSGLEHSGIETRVCGLQDLLWPESSTYVDHDDNLFS